MVFLALILAMMSEQKKSSHVQTALVSKPFEAKIPDTAQMKDLLKSFPNITNFNQFFEVEVVFLSKSSKANTRKTAS